MKKALLIFTCVLVSRVYAQDRAAIHEEFNIPFVENAGKDQMLDLFCPVGIQGFPMIVFLHGGGLTSGDKSNEPFAQIARNLVNNGIGCAMVNYRLAPKNKWPTMIRDAASAFAWVRHNIGIRGGDSTRIFIGGHSSGGYLSALLATDKKYMKKNKLTLSDIAGCIEISGMLNSSYHINGYSDEQLKNLWDNAKVVNAYESYFSDWLDYRDADPYYHLNKMMAPFIVLFGEDEEYVKLLDNQAKKFQLKALKAGGKVEVSMVKGRHHMTILYSMANPGDETMMKIVEFVKRTSLYSPH